MDVYVMKEGQRRGPYQPFRLTEMLEEGELTPKDSVWHEGMEKWQALEDTESLRAVLRKALARPAEAGPAAFAAPAAAAAKPATEEDFLLLRQRRAIAWRRFFARQIDMTICAAAVIIPAASMGWTDMWSLYKPESWAIVLAPPLIWIPLEALMLSIAGGTPGKLMLGLRVVGPDGNRPPFFTALKRSVLVWAGGMGFGLPLDFLLTPAQWIYGFWQYQKRGGTLWDHSAETHVAFRRLERTHAAGIALFTAAVTMLFAWVCFKAPLPSRFSDEERDQWEKLRKEAWHPRNPAENDGARTKHAGAPVRDSVLSGGGLPGVRPATTTGSQHFRVAIPDADANMAACFNSPIK